MIHPVPHLAFRSLLGPYSSQAFLALEIGQDAFNTYVSQAYLNNKSTKIKHFRLKTFSPIKLTKRHFNQLHKEKDIITTCLKKRLMWLEISGEKGDKNEQYIHLPRAISDSSGLPHKGQKSNCTKFYETRYKDIILTKFPEGWLPDVVILEGMFMINTVPIRIHTKMIEYCKYLLQRYLQWYLQAGTQEIHVVFDCPGVFENFPKCIEQARRDEGTDRNAVHEHFQFDDDTKIPRKWREVINCRICKRHLVMYIGDAFLKIAPLMLSGEQKLYVAGSGTQKDRNICWCVRSNGVEEIAVNFCSNAEEADLRVWLHAHWAGTGRKLIFSPDTDVYHIGMLQNDDAIVQINPLGRELKLINVNSLKVAIANDYDLKHIPPQQSPAIIVMLYILTGCDFVSFFVGLGKVHFLKTLYRYAEFITSDSKIAPGTLANPQPHGNGFLACIRLVASAYISKHQPAFGDDLPSSLFISFSNDSSMQHHHKFYNFVREKIWNRISFEDQLPPSIEALEKHWLRTVWVYDYWKQACHDNIQLLPVELFGWLVEGDSLKVEWDTEENVEAVKQRVAFLTHGCGCKTNCGSGRCKCYKSGQHCGPGCMCLDTKCVNKHTNATTHDISDSDSCSGSDSDNDS